MSSNKAAKPLSSTFGVLFYFAFLLLLNLTGVHGAVAGETWLKIDSQGGDYIGQGQLLFLTEADGWFPIVYYGGTQSDVLIHFATGNPQSYSIGWSLQFRAAHGQPLQIGQYTNADGRNYPNSHFIGITGEGRGCAPIGAFQVKEITFSENNTLLSFWAIFQQACEDSPRGLFGEVRYNADTRVTIDAPKKKVATQNELLTFTVNSRITSGNNASLSADNLPPGASFTDNGDNTGTFLWLPNQSQSGFFVVNFRATNNTGAHDEGRTLITVGTLIRVPTDFSTIQQAIDNALDGSRILVAPGTYRENIDFRGKWITVKSQNGPTSTIIDGGGHDSVVAFASGEDFDSVIEGFTVTNGFSYFNTPGYGDGGGIRVVYAEATIRGNIVTRNTACAGFGISVISGSAVIENNDVRENVHYVPCVGGTGGGGIGIVHGSRPLVQNNVVASNQVYGSGGGISLFFPKTPTIRNNIVYGNTASVSGGGLYLVSDTSMSLNQNLISANSAMHGGGIYWVTSGAGKQPTISSNTIADNLSGLGSGLYANWAGQKPFLLTNNIIRGSGGAAAIHCFRHSGSAEPLIKFNNVTDAVGIGYSGNCENPTGTMGNISADPRFRNPAGVDYRLTPTSPAIDVGDDDAVPELTTDLAGSPRRVDGSQQGQARIDMGAYEFTVVNSPAISIDDAVAQEGNSGVAYASFTVSLSHPISHVVSVDFATANATATGSSDYEVSAGTLLFAPGEVSKSILVKIFGDTQAEPHETFYVNLKNPTNAIIYKGQGIGTIMNDDGPPIIRITCPTDSLNLAISQASPGTMIYVSGPCYENIVVKSDKNRVSIDGQRQTSIEGVDVFNPVFAVRGKGILVQGFVITGGSNAIEVTQGSNVVINNNHIQPIRGHGVVVDQNAMSIITNNTIENARGAGILIRENSTARIGFNNDSETAPSPNKLIANSSGVVVTGSSSARIVGNEFLSNFRDSIIITSSSSADISFNKIDNGSGSGIYIGEQSAIQLGELAGSSMFELPNTTFYSNQRFGIECAQGSVVAGRLGSLTGVAGLTAFDATCLIRVNP